MAGSQVWTGIGGSSKEQGLVVDQKPGHSHRLTPQCFPCVIPASPSTHHLWMEVGGREECEEEDGER